MLIMDPKYSLNYLCQQVSAYGIELSCRYAAGVSMPSMPLGRSGIRVSRLALGSWRTYERIGRDQGVQVMQAAREVGINFLDDARYNDETGHAPLATGYSEVVFGELFRAAGWRRDEVIVSNKLWWEFWPDETPAQELSGSLGRADRPRGTGCRP
jgi:aryl-alcohol dehydrogenase-like predicted oxidoreductase